MLSRNAMVSTSAVVFTAVIHMLLRISVFYEHLKTKCSPAPQIGNWFFILSVFLMLLDNDIYPCRYRCIPIPCQVLVETIFTLVLTEFSSLVLWCSLQKALFSLSKCVLSNIYDELGGDFLVQCLLNLLGLVILFNTAIATGYYDKLQTNSQDIIRKTIQKISDIRRKRTSNVVDSRTVEVCAHHPPLPEDDDCLAPITSTPRNRRRRSRQ